MVKLGGTAIVMREERVKLDSYWTPPYAINLMLSMVKFEGTIWEPASGIGHISKVLEEKGYTVMSTDLRPAAYGEGGIDFLKTTRSVDNIVTNPPYSLAEEFVRHGLECMSRKLVLLLRLAFLESQARCQLFKSTPLERVLIHSARLDHWNGKAWERSGQFSHAWFVWDKENYRGITTLEWLL